MKMWKPRRLPQSNYKQNFNGLKPKNCESSASTDGSLFLILGLYVDIDSKNQSNNTTYTTNNT